MMRRGQGAFEYILMLSGVILVVIIILLILQGSISSTNNTLADNENKFGTYTTVDFDNHRTPNLYVAEQTGTTTITNTPCCSNVNSSTVKCYGPNSVSSTTICSANITCPSKYFNNATGTCG